MVLKEVVLSVSQGQYWLFTGSKKNKLSTERESLISDTALGRGGLSGRGEVILSKLLHLSVARATMAELCRRNNKPGNKLVGAALAPFGSIT